MCHWAVILAVWHLVDGDGVVFEPAVWDSVGAGQEEQEFGLVFFTPARHDVPEPFDVFILFIVALIFGEAFHLLDIDGGNSSQVLANFSVVEQFQHVDWDYLLHS